VTARLSLNTEELSRENQNLRQQLRAISDVLRAGARSEGLQPVLDEIVEAAKRLCRGEHGQLYLVDGDVFRIFSQAYSQTVSPDAFEEAFAYAAEHPHGRDRTTVVGRVGLTGAVEQIPDVLADADYAYEAQRIIGYRSLLGVPIILDGELIGVVTVGRDVPGRFSNEEVELVTTFADQAAITIANARLLDAVERQRAELSRFISPQIADLVSSERGEHLLAGHRAYISCLFCDLRGFTAFAETAAPEELLEVLRSYHEALGELIPAHDGTLEHFAGDGLMVFFNDPIAIEDHELQAIRLGLAAQERFRELAVAWRRRGLTGLGLGIGIEAGYATLGRIGFEGRHDYGALGPVTNFASRLSTRAEAGQILVGPRVFGAVEERVDAGPVGELELKGFGRPISAYEVRGLR
jgi:class 3 adenylate cyclase